MLSVSLISQLLTCFHLSMHTYYIHTCQVKSISHSLHLARLTCAIPILKMYTYSPCLLFNKSCHLLPHLYLKFIPNLYFLIQFCQLSTSRGISGRKDMRLKSLSLKENLKVQARIKSCQPKKKALYRK